MGIDLALNERQSLIQATAHDFFSRNCTPAVVRSLEASEIGYSTEMWSAMAKLGWLGIQLPEQYGGAGGSFLDLYPLYLEFGRYLVPSPHLESVVLGAEVVLAAGTEAQKKELLPSIADGSTVVSVAILEPNGEHGPHGITVSAGRSGEGYLLNGTKMLVPWVSSADRLLCAARTGGQGGADGISLFLMDTSGAGITSTRIENIGGYPLFEVVFNDVTLSSDSLIGSLHDGWGPLSAAISKASVLQSAMIVGAGHRVLDMTAGYAKDRVQFGQPIGRHQAVQYMVTDILIDMHLAKLLTLQAAWRIDAGLPYVREAALASAAATKASTHMVRQAHEVHAGVGYMMEYDLQLYSRRATNWEAHLGDYRYHLERAMAEIAP